MQFGLMDSSRLGSLIYNYSKWRLDGSGLPAQGSHGPWFDGAHCLGNTPVTFQPTVMRRDLCMTCNKIVTLVTHIHPQILMH